MFVCNEYDPMLCDSIENLFSTSSTTTKNHLVCVNYVPITTVRENHTLYAMVSKRGCDPTRLLLKKSYGSQAEAAGSFRKQYLRLNTLRARAQETYSSEDIDTGLLSQVEQLAEQVADISSICIELRVHAKYISDLASELATVVNETHEARQQAECCKKILKRIDDICAVPEGIIDLLAYVEVCYNSVPIRVLHIEELSAINIITKEFDKLETDAQSGSALLGLTDARIAYDRHMLFANYQLLSAFMSPTLSRKRFDIPVQETYWCLGEYVPIAMKFWHVYHPLLDYHPVVQHRIWDSLADKFSMIKTAECITNLCGSHGHRLDVGDTLFSAEDLNTEHIGHIFYGMCSDFNEIFTDRKAVPEAHQIFAYSVSPKREKWMPNNLIYTPHLAGAVVYKMLETATELDGYSGKDSYYVLPAKDETGILCFHEREGNVGSISDIVTRQSPRLVSSEQDRTHSLTASGVELARAMLSSIELRDVSFARVISAVSYLSDALAKANVIGIGSQWL